MELIREFKDITKNDANLAGGKGASLGEMTTANIPVPPGFVVLAGTFKKFLEETDLDIEVDAILDSVNHNEVHTVEFASEKIQALIMSVDMPKDIEVAILNAYGDLKKVQPSMDEGFFVAVRSSATAEDSASAAWAGQLDSYLNTTEETLLKNVKRCWASLFTPRAIFYRFEKDLHKTKISVAVIIQKMVAPDVSGVVFSVHPVTEDYNQLIIEAGFGLGEAIVSGSITPDSYVVEKSPRRIIDKNIAEQTKAIYRAEGGGDEWRDIPKARQNVQKLTDGQILELSDLIIKIENHYGFPCDIEWTVEGSTFYITQSRPITTLTGVLPNSSPATLPEASYELHFRQSGFLFIFTDINFNPKNGAFDYVILQNGGDMAAYLTIGGWKQAHEMGKTWLTETESQNKIEELELLLGDLRSGVIFNSLHKLQKDDYAGRWRIVEDISDRFARLYRYCEHPVVSAIETEILRACSFEDNLLKVLRAPQYADELKFTPETRGTLMFL
ncbi:MAG: PEP/pyruvate-binding domain-containing protein [Candidatus Vogelbacteria bacterium]|nr:PEP/pyruvate-binding domain-containing protein [Candidatus Vogelbacteria bacterium]